MASYTKLLCRSCCRAVNMFRRLSSSAISEAPSASVAIVGSGPSGFYCAASLVRLTPNIMVDIFEKLPVPFGLLRFGVAPDHPEVKNAQHAFERLMNASNTRCRFFGNVNIGTDITFSQLRSVYDVVVLAYGSEGEKELRIVGADAATNLFSARRFVGWYNGLPDDADLSPTFDTDTAVVLGHGNVALDVARMLLLPIDILRKTDITEHALQALASSKIKRVIITGRRGPLQVAFTIKELREMISLPGSIARFDVNDFDGIDEGLIERLPRSRRRLTKLMMDTAIGGTSSTKTNKDLGKEWSLRFLRTPKSVLKATDSSIQGLTCTINSIAIPDDLNRCGGQQAISTGIEETIDCGLLLSSIGYRTLQIDSDISFDTTAHRVLSIDGSTVGHLGSGVYACGWCVRGPVGVLNTTQIESSGLAKIIANDIGDGAVQLKPNFLERIHMVSSLLKDANVPYVTWNDWLRVDAVERRKGEAKGKPREKIVDKSELLRIAVAMSNV